LFFLENFEANTNWLLARNPTEKQTKSYMINPHLKNNDDMSPWSLQYPYFSHNWGLELPGVLLLCTLRGGQTSDGPRQLLLLPFHTDAVGRPAFLADGRRLWPCLGRLQQRPAVFFVTDEDGGDGWWSWLSPPSGLQAVDLAAPLGGGLTASAVPLLQESARKIIIIAQRKKNIVFKYFNQSLSNRPTIIFFSLKICAKKL